MTSRGAVCDWSAQEIAGGVPEFYGWGIKVRCLEGIDLDAIPVKRIYGSKLD